MYSNPLFVNVIGTPNCVPVLADAVRAFTAITQFSFNQSKGYFPKYVFPILKELLQYGTVSSNPAASSNTQVQEQVLEVKVAMLSTERNLVFESILYLGWK